MSIEVKRLEVQLVGVTHARMMNELKVQELGEAIERLNKDIQISLAKETELTQAIESKKEQVQQ